MRTSSLSGHPPVSSLESNSDPHHNMYNYISYQFIWSSRTENYLPSYFCLILQYQERAFSKPQLNEICSSLSPDAFINPHKSVFGWGYVDLLCLPFLPPAVFDSSRLNSSLFFPPQCVPLVHKCCPAFSVQCTAFCYCSCRPAHRPTLLRQTDVHPWCAVCTPARVTC